MYILHQGISSLSNNSNVITILDMQKLKLFALGAMLLAGFVTNTSAQELGKIHYRVEAGPTLSKVSNFALDHLSDSGKGLINFRAGVSFALPFVHTPFTLAPGIFFNGRGERQTGNRNNAPKPLAKLQTYAVQVPVDFSFRIITVEENQHVFLNVTPYASYLLSAKITRGGSPIIDVAGDPLKVSEYDLISEGNAKKFEAGLQASLMYRYSSLYVRAGIEFSVLNQLSGEGRDGLFGRDTGASRYVSSFLTVGYEF